MVNTATQKQGQQGAWGNTHAPSKPLHKKYEVGLSDKLKSRVANLILNYFLFEQPPAQSIKLVDNSLRQLDEVNNVWAASVQTIVYYKKIAPRVHTSRVRFRILCEKDITNIETSKINIHKNQVIFI
jgi:hypothetical protein